MGTKPVAWVCASMGSIQMPWRYASRCLLPSEDQCPLGDLCQKHFGANQSLRSHMARMDPILYVRHHTNLHTSFVYSAPLLSCEERQQESTKSPHRKMWERGETRSQDFSKARTDVQNSIVCTPTPEVLSSTKVRTLFRRSAPRPDSLPKESGAAVIRTFLEQTSAEVMANVAGPGKAATMPSIVNRRRRPANRGPLAVHAARATGRPQVQPSFDNPAFQI